MLKKYRIKYFNFRLVVMLIAITIMGILAVGSADKSIQDKQIMGFIAGFFLMILLSLFDYSVFLNLHWIIYIGNILMLILVEIPGIGIEVGGATRWIKILGIQFQPSELAKILLILFYAQYIMKNREKLNTFRVLATMILLMLPPLYLIENQPDLSTSIMVVIIFCTILFVGGLSYKILFSILAVAIPSVIIFLSIVLQPGQKLIQDYQQDRILAWLQPEKYANTVGYQQSNAITAIGSGQLWGKGYDNNVIASVKNGNFISESQTDFIFAIVGEELGFVGGCVVIVLLLLITLECLLIARRAKDLGGTLICTGMAALIGFQSFLNISVATGLLPNTGIPLPFISAGLTSLVSIYIGMGFVLNVGLQNNKKY